MASKQQTIAAAVRTLVIAAGVDPCFIGHSQISIGEGKYPYGEIYIDWLDYDRDAFLVADQQYELVVRVADKTQDEAAEKAEAILPALLNAAGRAALFAAGAINVRPWQSRKQGENIAPVTTKYHRDIVCRLTVRHLVGS